MTLTILKIITIALFSFSLGLSISNLVWIKKENDWLNEKTEMRAAYIGLSRLKSQHIQELIEEISKLKNAGGDLDECK